MNRRFKATCVLLLNLLPAAAIQGQDFELAPVQVLSNRETRVTLSTPPNLNYDIQVSSNLNTWDSLATFLVTNTSLQHTDSATPFLPLRFYRGQQGNGTNAVTGDHLVTAEGDVVIHPRNHAEVILHWMQPGGQTITILADPTNRSPFYIKANLILLTHGHGDHVSTNALNNLVDSGTILVASPSAYSALSTTLKLQATVLSNTQTTTFVGIGIEAVAAYNISAGKLSYHPTNGGGCGFILTIGGKRIYIAGDTEDTPEMRALRNIDVAFLPMNMYTMTTAQAVSAVRAFQPKVLYPFHTGGSGGPTPADLVTMKSQMMTNPGVEVRLRKWY